eukprot:jgi/Hompol1/779/HPOL_005408-RA
MQTRGSAKKRLRGGLEAHDNIEKQADAATSDAQQADAVTHADALSAHDGTHGDEHGETQSAKKRRSDIVAASEDEENNNKDDDDDNDDAAAATPSRSMRKRIAAAAASRSGRSSRSSKRSSQQRTKLLLSDQLSDTPENNNNNKNDSQNSDAAASPSRSVTALRPKNSNALIQTFSPRTPRTLHSPHTPCTPRTPSSVYQEAKAAFRRCVTPSRLIGRNPERSTIRSFLVDHVLRAKHGSMYISGCPGTGKTALVDESSFPIIVAKLNCMNISDPKSVYSKLLSLIGHPNVPTKDASKTLESLVVSSKIENPDRPFYLFVLDELDQLVSSDQDVLYQLFDWSNVTLSRLAIIGIANAIDLTSRFLPRLKTKNCEPLLLNFNPYQVSEIADIIKDRLLSVGESQESDEACAMHPSTPSRSSTNAIGHGAALPTKSPVPLIQPMAIELAARKIADTGDVRKALDVCRHAIEIAESEERKRIDESSVSATTPVTSTSASTSAASHLQQPSTPTKLTKTPTAAAAAATAIPLPHPKVTPRHILSAATLLLGSPQTNRINSLSLQHKLVLCTLHIMKLHAMTDFSIQHVFEVYVVLCRYKHLVATVQRSEFSDLISVLESDGIVSIGKPKTRVREIGGAIAAGSAGGSGASGSHAGGRGILSLIVRSNDLMSAVETVPLLVSLLENADAAIKSAKLK